MASAVSGRPRQPLALHAHLLLGANDLFIAMGAGDVHEIAEALVEGGA